MKRLPGEKTGSRTGPLKNSFILFFLILTNLSFSQTPINGFCYRNDYSLPKGFDGIISADLNSNSNAELIFYSPTSKQIGIYSGLLKEESVFKEFPVIFEISQLKRIKNKADLNNLFAVVERKKRKVSLINIFIDSVYQHPGEISFDSYPENILNGDIDLNGNDEILVYGSGFDGLSVLFQADGGIGESKIVTGTSFSEAAFIDVNDDGYPDVAAFDIFNNSLSFFINNTAGVFRATRSVPYSEKISLLKSVDMNNDGIPDIIYSIDNSIEILFGDYQSTFKKRIYFKLEGKPSSIQIGDFNSDKIPDIAYSISNNSLTIIFGKNGQEFYERIPYLNNTSLIALNVFKNGTSSNLACLTGSGELIVISSDHFSADEMDISLAIEANAIKKFDYENDGIPDIAFVDEYDNSLKLLVNNSTSTTAKFYSIPVAEDHKEIQVDEFFSFRKIFYCYSKGTPLLEIFRYNFRTDMLNRKQLYAPGGLLDVSFQRIDSSFVNIYVLYNKNSKMYLGKFENRDVSITFREYPFIDRNVSSAELFILDEPLIYYWKSDGDQLQFNSARIKSGPNEYKTHLMLPNKNDYRINFYGADRYNNEYPSVVSIAQNESENYLAIVSAGQVRISKKIIEPPKSKPVEFGNAYFGETSIKGLINFTINSISDNYIYKLIYRQNEKSHLLNQTFVAENLSDYLFARLDKKNYFLVYSNKDKGCISIKSLKK